MNKIPVKGPVVELDGDEMTRIIWKKIREEVSLSITYRVYPKGPALYFCFLHTNITLAIIQLILLYLQLDIKSVLQFGIVLPSQGVHAVFVCVELLILITASRSQMIKLLWSHHTTQSQYQMRNHFA